MSITQINSQLPIAQNTFTRFTAQHSHLFWVTGYCNSLSYKSCPVQMFQCPHSFKTVHVTVTPIPLRSVEKRSFASGFVSTSAIMLIVGQYISSIILFWTASRTK